MVCGGAARRLGAMTSTPSSAGLRPVRTTAGSQPPPAYQQAPADQPPAGPRVTAGQVRDLGRLRRTVTDRKVAGVAGGIARHLDIDPLIMRVAFVVLTLFGGAGLIVYAACWILLPEDGQQQPPLGLDERSRSVALILVGILGVALLVGQWDWFWVPGPLILVALVVWLVMSRRNDRGPRRPAAPPPGVPNAGPDAVTPEQRWASAPPAPAYDVPVERSRRPSRPPYRRRTRRRRTDVQQAYQPPAPRRSRRGTCTPARATRASADRSCSGSPWLWPPWPWASSASSTSPAPPSPDSDLPGRRRRRDRRDAAGRLVLRARRWADPRRPAGRGGHRDRARLGEDGHRPRGGRPDPVRSEVPTATTTAWGEYVLDLSQARATPKRSTAAPSGSPATSGELDVVVPRGHGRHRRRPHRTARAA